MTEPLAPFLPVATPFRLDVSADHVAVIDAGGRPVFEGPIVELATAKLIAAAPVLRKRLHDCLGWFAKANAPGDAGCDFLNRHDPDGGQAIAERLEVELASTLLELWVAP